MGRERRNDEAGAWFHVMNRGIAKRSVFENATDVAFFTAKTAEAVARKCFRVHAFCLMATHFHLLVESLGGLSEGMRRLENEYVRRFNMRSGRDGSLFRGRFLSKRVDGLVYRRIVVRYIDHNPVQAGLVPEPAAYPHGSAFLQRHPPPWLCRDWLRDELEPWLRQGRAWHEAYRAAFADPVQPDHVYVVERALAKGGRAPVGLDDLIGSAPSLTRFRMLQRARLADGTAPASAWLGPDAVIATIAASRRSAGAWQLPAHHASRDGWRTACIGLLRDACAMTFTHIAQRTGTSLTIAHHDYVMHRDLLRRSEAYEERFNRLGARALESCYENRCQTPP